MGFDSGFDMVPKLSHLPSSPDLIKWKEFLDAVLKKYKYDPIFKITPTYYEFYVGETPRLPLDGGRFLSCSSKISGSCNDEAYRYLKDLYKIATVYFGDRVKWSWDDHDGLVGRYEWDTMHKFLNYDEKIKDTKNGLECYPEFEPRDIIQDFVEPFVKVLNLNEIGKQCNNCFKNMADIELLIRCKRCEIFTYCDRKCQTEDWNAGGHEIECETKLHRKVSKYYDVDVKQSPWTYQILRTLSKLNQQPDLATKEHYIYNGTTRNFKDLLENVQNSLGLDDIGTDCEKLCGKLVKYKLLPKSVIEEEVKVKQLLYVQGLIELWSRFGIEIRSEDDKVIGHSLFIEGSFFEHSCQPSAVRIISDNKLQVQCIKTIPHVYTKGFEKSYRYLFTPSKPTINYISSSSSTILQNFKQRQTLLKTRYGINCCCDLCCQEFKSN